MKKILLAILLTLFHVTLPTQFLAEEGFVTFATSNYFGLLEVLLDSVHEFSSRPIVVFVVNADFPFSLEKYPRVIVKRINADATPGRIFFQKCRIIKESGLKYGVYVEADDIVYKGVDNLFKHCRRIDKYPLCPLHPQDPNDQKNIMDILGVKEKSMPYIHAHMLFSYKCMDFIKEWYNLCLSYGVYACNFDETILNVLFWKYGIHDYVNVYDPYFESIRAYEKNEEPEGYKGLKIDYYMFHGCKNPVDARKVLNKLKELAKK